MPKTLFISSTARASWVQSTPERSFFHCGETSYWLSITSIVVEFAKESRPRHRDVYEADRAARARRPPGHRLIVSGISRDTSWQVCIDFNPASWLVLVATAFGLHPGHWPLSFTARIRKLFPLTSIVSSDIWLNFFNISGSQRFWSRSWQCFLRGH